VKLTVGGKEWVALVDTGAACSLISPEVAGAARPLPEDPPQLTSVTGSTVSTLSVVELDVLTERVKFVVGKGFGEHVIIGTEFLTQFHGKIDYGIKVVRLAGQNFPFIQLEGQKVVGKLDFLVKEFPEVLANDGILRESKGLTPLRIETEGPPVYQRPYRAPLQKRAIIEKAVEEMLEQGIISPSSSPWASPVTLVPKKDGTSRFCVDYRRLNAVTRKDRYPLPHIQDIFDTVGKGKVFSVLDLRSGYWQLPVAAEDRCKTAFTCHVGQFEYNRVSFGLSTAPSHFQRQMNGVFHTHLGRFVLIFIDDIVVYSENEAQHREHLREVFRCLSKAGLQLKLSKCSFMQASVDLLGFRIGANGIAPLEEKVKAISDLPPPQNVKAVRSFLGLANYYRQCVKGYAQIAEPIVALTRKAVPFEWSADCQAAFEQLKQALTGPQVMAHPDVNKPYSLYVDACNYAVGAVLVQMDDHGIERPIQYISHQLSSVQRKWATIEKEAYALIYALQKLRPYLLGAEYTIYTDHRPLRSLFTKEMVNTKIQRWAILLAEYGAKIEYRQGIHNIRADTLSRLPSESMLGEAEVSAIECDGQDVTLPILLDDAIDLPDLKDAQREEYMDLIMEANDPEGGDEYVMYAGVLFSEQLPHANAPDGPRLVLPHRYQRRVMEVCHKEVGHMSVSKTMKRITEEYVWPGLRRDVRDYINQCADCAVFRRTQVHVPMQDVEVPAGPMQIVHMDFIGPYVADPQGNRYVLTVIDYLTGWVEAYALPDQSAKTIIDAVALRLFTQHSKPRAIVSDNGQGFGSRQWAQFLEQSGVECRRTTPVHPQGNAKIERLNRTLKDILVRLMRNRPEDWYVHLPAAVQAYRMAVSDVTGYSPFFLLYGREPRPLCGEDATIAGGLFGNRLDNLAAARKAAQEEIEASRRYNRRRLADRANVVVSLEVGDRVATKAEERTTGTAYWDPGFVVTRVRGTTHWLNNPETGINKKLHREKLRLVTDIDNQELEAVPPRPRRRFKPRKKMINMV
jgi:transposase InsO family protein